ncbi:MAG TPA: gluconate 2-dehydrogenase subunit 3 family protein [Cyclobacteriaceae bacterium]|nr:gluconate 2-dehydrogenase subunit 3 family protein [Cyclobacteriaceae bacterium]HRJ81668.1 gluconate 2-dehydrogenase subunit 3 family protein [Cyclobacteriaceae bacterium]
MNRREVIKRTALLMGGVVSAPAIMGILKGCQAKPGIDWTPEFFTADQAYVITEVAEIIIPKTDTPGAKEAGVPSFIEQMIFKAYKEADREKFITALDDFTATSGFLKLNGEKQKAYVLEAHQKAIEEKPEQRPFVMMMKELTMLGFFTSKPGATEVLRYEAVPGYYNGCMPLSEVGKTWAT